MPGNVGESQVSRLPERRAVDAPQVRVRIEEDPRQAVACAVAEAEVGAVDELVEDAVTAHLVPVDTRVARPTERVGEVGRVHDPVADVADPSDPIGYAVRVDDTADEAAVIEGDRERGVVEVPGWACHREAEVCDGPEDPIDVVVRADGSEIIGAGVVQEV